MKKSAVFTMVKNEKWFLPIWLNYYLKFYDQKDVYIIDHASTDESIQMVKDQYPEINILDHITYEPFDDIFKINEIKKLQTQLLKDYQCVIYSDPDELVVPVNEKYEHISLTDYIDNFINKPFEAIQTNGWELIHLRHRGEQSINLTESVLSQRSFWFNSQQWYSKVLLSKVPSQWTPGLHTTSNGYTKDPFLLLIHLHRIDYNLAYIKNIINTSFKRPPGMNLGGHVFITNPDEFHKHFWGMENDSIIETIPNNLKQSNIF